ncbi:MAG: phosphatidylinositol kinase [Micrococcales bacterium]|nr:MAG: phosphatidylinositol kinase [Micrococcales bacterium]PIE28225.1 MAG: phosphatidylinositol kinase [Micrococcales bacterium]
MNPVTDPRDVRRAIVVKQGVPAATLRRLPGAVEFAYEGAYLDSGGPAVATTLPLTDEPVRTVAGAVPAFFANLLPEGRRLTALRRAVKTSADDELSLLLAIGSDPVGDVQVLAEGIEPEHGTGEEPVVDHFDELDFSVLLSSYGIGDPSALAGVHEKVSGRMLTVPLVHGGGAHLLKFQVPEFPHVVANEAYFLSVARRLRHPVVQAKVVHDRQGRPGLLVTRFDRVTDADGQLQRLPVEDGAQLLGLYPADKYAVTSEDLARRVGQVCAARPVALRAVFQQLVFAWLTGNGDLHAKNVSVVGTQGEWRVAPIYDVPSTVPYADTTAALPLAGRRENLTRRAFLGFAADIGLPHAAAELTLAEALAATEPVIEQVQDGVIPFDHRRIQDLVRTLRRRRRDLH